MSRSRDIANLLGAGSVILSGAPSALDTLDELAAALGDDANYASTVTTALNNRVLKTGGDTITVSSGTTVPLTIQNNGTGNSFVVNDEASDANPFVINSSGNVGIGTANPSNRLEVATPSGDSVILSTGPSTSAGYIAANGNGRSGLTGAVNLISYSSGVAELTNRSNAALVFGTNNTERMRIDASGNVQLSSAGTQITNSAGRPILKQSGSVLQTQYVSSGTRTTVNSTSFTEPSTAYRVDITPNSTSSYIVLYYYIPLNPGGSYASNTIFSIRAFRSVGGSKTYSLTSAGTTNGSRNVMSGITFRPPGYDMNDPTTQNFIVVDAPATTSTCTYGFEIMRETGGTGTLSIGYSTNDSSIWGFDTDIVIVAQEIAQ